MTTDTNFATGPASRSPRPERNDTGNALRLIERCGADLRYAEGLGWLVWDGRRWARDTADAVTERAKETARAIHLEAATATSPDDAKAISNWALRSGDGRRIEAMLKLAASDPRVRVAADALDRDPYLLNVANGTVVLRTGALRAHDRADLITRLSPVEFDERAHLTEWDRFLATVLPDADVREYVAKAAGYTALGRTGEDVLIVIHGVPRAGKGTLQDAIATALGEYALTVSPTAFEERPGKETRPELVAARGRRMLNVYETSARLRVDAALVKTLTGGDEISVRELYSNPITYRPTFTVWIASNHRPRIDYTDDAAWTRVREIPFTRTVPPAEIDRELRRRLADPAIGGPSVLAWIVAGARRYLLEGLRVPTAVARATSEYRDEMNPLREWLEDTCETGPVDTMWERTRDLREAYVDRCKREGVARPVSPREFANALRAIGCVPEKRNGERVWSGVALRTSRITQKLGPAPKVDRERVSTREKVPIEEARRRRDAKRLRPRGRE